MPVTRAQRAARMREMSGVGTDGVLRVTAAEARRLAIAAQRLVPPRGAPTRRGVLEILRDLGFLQIDPTNVVARSPLLVLWSRIGRFDPALVEGLLASRDLFETASLIVPMSDLPIHSATMRAYRAATSGQPTRFTRGSLEGAGGGTWPERAAAMLARNPQLRRSVLSRLKRDGPLPVTAFEDRAIGSWTSGQWDDERNVSMMLTILQRRGEVVVAGRRRGQKLWALANGWLPAAAPLSGAALARETATRALRALGVATRTQLRRHHAFGTQVTRAALDELEGKGLVRRVTITDGARAWSGTWYAPGDVVELLASVHRSWEERTTLLSPFDNLIADRARTEQLFSYRYRTEIYTPPHLRKLGYWAMPVLHGDRIIGSVDPRFERARGELVVNKVVLDSRAPRDAMRPIRTAVDELAAFVGATKIRWP